MDSESNVVNNHNEGVKREDVLDLQPNENENASANGDDGGATKLSHSSSEEPGTNGSKARKRKKKVEIACVYCRRSHMICDDSRPCQRCIKRGIGHLCYDEPSNLRQKKKAASLRRTTSDNSGAVTPVSSSPYAQSPLPAPPIPNQQNSNIPLSTNSDIASIPIPTQAQIQNQLQQQQQQLPPPQHLGPVKNLSSSVLAQTLPYNQEPFFYSEHAGSEFSSLNDFLSMIDDPELVNGALNDDPTASDPMLNFNVGSNATTTNPVSENFTAVANTNNNSATNLNSILAFSPNSNLFPATFPNDNDVSNQQQQQIQLQQTQQQQLPPPQQVHHQQQQQQQLPKPRTDFIKPASGSITPVEKNGNNNHQPVISDSARDKFFLTAADPTTEISPEERLKQVIKAKLEAGLLQPYNYAKGYARLQNYMDNYMNLSSRQRILKPLSIFRPAFRAIARTLKDVDLVLVEESFERMLLDYDRVFTSMAIPACLWRRTGEIYRGNKEFASLVGVMTDDLKDGKLAIYELMSEESAVNFWEKYGAIAFDKGQKAVLTSCNLRTKDGIKRKSCCFSFTIRRDRYNIPSCIVGNFIPIDP